MGEEELLLAAVLTSTHQSAACILTSLLKTGKVSFYVTETLRGFFFSLVLSLH